MFFSVDDLGSGYWHCTLHPDSYPYCGNFCLNPETGKRHYFTQITTPSKIYLRLHCGLLIFIYTDDIFLGAKSVCT